MKYQNVLIGFFIVLVIGGVAAFLNLPQEITGTVKILPGTPMPIPHTVEGRRRCVACHVGPAAREDLRTSHPERISCMQCHVPRKTMEKFKRPL